MPVHFGMPTLIEMPSLAQSLQLCSALELDFVEVNMNLPEYQINSIDISAAKKLLAGTGKYCTIHLDENLNVCDFNPLVAEAYQKTVLQTIALAKQLQTPIINMHMSTGVYFTLPDQKVYLFEQYQDIYLQRLQHFRNICEQAIGSSDITICIENCGVFHGFQQQGIDLLLESPCFALTYDIGHDFSVGNGNEAFILARLEKLRHMHVHDATDKKDHLPLGEGDIPLGDKLVLARKCGCRCVLEVKTIAGLRKSVQYYNEQL